MNGMRLNNDDIILLFAIPLSTHNNCDTCIWLSTSVWMPDVCVCVSSSTLLARSHLNPCPHTHIMIPGIPVVQSHPRPHIS